jgi:hypothetical protein
MSDKKPLLRNILDECVVKSKMHQQKHKKLKRIDDVIDVVISSASASAICLLLSGVGLPFAIGLQGLAFVLSAVSKSCNWKTRYLGHNQTSRNYNDLSREIATTLARNHMSNDDVIEYLETVNHRISLIEDTEL